MTISYSWGALSRVEWLKHSLEQVSERILAARIGARRWSRPTRVSPSPKGGSEKGDPTNKSLKQQVYVTRKWPSFRIPLFGSIVGGRRVPERTLAARRGARGGDRVLRRRDDVVLAGMYIYIYIYIYLFIYFYIICIYICMYKSIYV